MDTSDFADAFDGLVDDALIWVSDNGAFLFDCAARRASRASMTASSGS